MPGKGDIATLLSRQHTEFVDPWANFAKYAQSEVNRMEEQKRYEAEKAQKDLLFNQAQDDRTRQQNELKAKDLFAKGLLQGPQTTNLDMNQWVGVGGEKLGGMEVLQGHDSAGNTVYTDKTGRILSSAEKTARENKQMEFGALPSTSAFKITESRPEFISRIIADINKAGLPTASLIPLLEEAKASELSEQKKGKAEANAKVESIENALLKLQDNKWNDYKGLNFENSHTVVDGSTTMKEDEELGMRAKSKVAQDKYKATQGLTGEAAAKAKKVLEDEVVGFGTKLASLFGASDKDKVQEYMNITKDIAAPEVAANYARLYGKKAGLFETEMEDPKKLREGLLQYIAQLDQDTENKGSSRSTSLSQTTNQYRRVGGAPASAIAEGYKAREQFLLDNLRKAKDALRIANMTPEERKEAKQEAAKKQVEELLTWRYGPTATTEKDNSTEVPTASTLTKVLEKPSVPKTTVSGKSTNIVHVTPKQKEKITEEVKEVAKTFSVDNLAKYAKWKKEMEQDGIEPGLLGPLDMLIGGKVTKDAIKKLPTLVSKLDVPESLVGTRIGGFLEKLGMKRPMKLLPRFPGQIDVPRGGFNNPNILDIKAPLFNQVKPH